MPRNNLSLVVACLLLGGVLPGERALPSPDGPGTDAQAPRFSSGAALVTVDVVVLDDSGEPLEGLTADDFTILDEGRPRLLTRFEAVALHESPATAAPELSFASTNASATGPSLRTFVVVFDDVHMSHTAASQARDAVWDFVETLRVGDRVTLVPTSGGAWWHARIPEGRHDLLGAMRRLVGRRLPTYSADRMSDYEAMRLHIHRDLQVGAEVSRRFAENRALLDPACPPPCVRKNEMQLGETHPLARARASEIYFQALARKQATYAALQEVAESLEVVRGRKAILFLSEGFIQEPGRTEHRDMVRAAQRANAAIHFIDARGLGDIPATADIEYGDPTDARDVAGQMGQFNLAALGAVSLAVDTGGRVIKNSNDLARGLQRLERESRAYYLLGFEPTGVEPDGGFRSLDVAVSRPGVEILARKGYFAPSAKPETPEDGEEEGLDPALRLALDSPFDADAIPLRMVSYVLGPADGGTTVLLVADVDPRALGFEEKDGTYQDTLALHLVVSHRDTGERLHRGHEVELGLPPAASEQIRRSKLPLMIDIPLRPGRHQARLLVRDARSGRVGTVRHDLAVPAPDAFRVSTPILTDVVAPASDDDSSLLRPRPLVRRTFVSGSTLTLAYDVHGAGTLEGAAPRVVAGFLVESANGTVVATGPVGVLPPGPEGQVAQIADVSLEEVPAGIYAVVVKARDEVDGSEVVTRVPFRVAPRPGTAVLEETVAEDRTEDPLDRVRRYLLEYGETKQE